MQMMRWNVLSRSPYSDTEGSSFVELAIVLPMFFLMLVPAVDIGRALYAYIEVASAAQAGAAYGLQNPSDASGMQAAAIAGTANLPGVTSTATYGCECSDGTSQSASCTSTPSCTYNYVNYVDVVASSTYVPTFNYPGLPSSMNISKEVRLRVGSN
jgi:Flp pilus assembly protein TadG